MWAENVKEVQALNRVAESKDLAIALEKNQLGEKIQSVGEHKNSFPFPTGLKHLQFQYLQSV